VPSTTGLRILFVYPTIYPDLIGGVEQRNYELASALSRRGHRVTLAGLQRGPRPATAELSFVAMGRLDDVYNPQGRRSTRQALRFAWRVPRLELGDYDVVETANIPYVHLLPLSAKCALAGKPLLVTWYEYWGVYWARYVGRLRAPLYRLVERVTAMLGTAVTATSELTRGRLARRRRGAVDVVPCGIRVDLVRAAAAQEVRGSGPPLVFAGRLLADKRVDLLLRSLPALASRHSGPLLTVFGDGPERGRLAALAGELGLADRVLFRGYVADNAEVWRQLGRARLAVQPSEREGFGLFPLEAMAAGLPVVYCESAESAVPELVRHGVEGVCCPPEPRALAAALARLLDDPGEWQRLSTNAGERAGRYDWDEIAREIEQRCLALTGSRPLR
jgi:glycosyltransferase involved in cell wall biosynthesis